MRLAKIVTSFVACFLLIAGAAQAQQTFRPDSTQLNGVGALPPSNCPNIQTQWYATGQMPAGYYKQASSPYHCLPIPACTSNQTFDQATSSCGCPAGTIWDGAYNSCHAPCAAGTAWNGSACVNSCPAGTAWNGSSCASICAAGTAWNGSSCASVCAAGTAWNGSSCESVCAAGTSWNGSSCASVCSGGQTWNGSACACPAGQVFANGSCGAAPAFSLFGISPLSQYVGSSHTVSWATSGSGTVNVSLLCSGATAATNSLTPPASGTGALAVTRPGSTDCIAQASNEWGTAQASSPTLTSSCPPGTSWSGAACAVAATPQGSLNGKTITVNAKPYSPIQPWQPFMTLTGTATAITVRFTNSQYVNYVCTLSTAGSSCVFGTFNWYGSGDAQDAYNLIQTWELNGSGFFAAPATNIAKMTLNADGSLSAWGLQADGGSCEECVHVAYTINVPASTIAAIQTGTSRTMSVSHISLGTNGRSGW